MLKFPIISITKETQELTDRILVLSEILQTLPSSSSLEPKIFHQQFLKSSLFSARIEGNTLTLLESQQPTSVFGKQREKKEVNNILHILQHLSLQELPRKASSLQKLHRQIMNTLDSDAGKLRSESSAIFDQFGNVIYLTPSPEEVKKMLVILCTQLTKPVTTHELFAHVAACHYYFEKIHPFLDGNGRTGRVLLQLQLRQSKLFGEYVVPIDEYFDQHRPDYYFFLEKNTRYIDSYILFFLKGLIASLEHILADVKTFTEAALSEREILVESHANLLPRRQEVVLILQDHPFASLDFLTRRFATVPRRTLAYDLQWLVGHHYVIKHGETRGTSYSATLWLE